MTNIQCCPIPLSPKSSADELSYLEAMYHLCYLISDRLNPDATAAPTYEKIIENCQEFESLRQRVYPHLRNKEALRTAVDRLQHYALRLHTSFCVSVCLWRSFSVSRLRSRFARPVSLSHRYRSTETVANTLVILYRWIYHALTSCL